ncbi:hypothetical protein T4B_5932 [Trichinella pseudospiralis]|uniref:Uncharacterized protein n=1 Tax=Trichinella pseudospiralis TaxID=6337 RepID=A0A0V1IXB1_TRIPS|nr:hypothetical protein T4A_3321 [Trichinella pseudospiralis]KRZ27401.1 hypothetical protein T4B_5932 [Trichinella pseudospiralis]
MDGKQLLTPLWYNLESTIRVPGSHGYQQSDNHSKCQYMPFVVLNIVAVYRRVYPFKKGQNAGCGWLGGRGGSCFIINDQNKFCFFRVSFFQRRLFSNLYAKCLSTEQLSM